MKNIMMLFCGGTLSMVKNKRGSLVPGENIVSLLEKIPHVEKLANIDSKIIENIDSSNITPEIWQKIVFQIKENYAKYDGFIIIHGTDTMCYSASFVSFAIDNLTKPVIFTGGQKTLDSVASDGINNILNSLLVADKGIPEIMIVFGTKILKGNRSTKISESHLDAFDSPLFPPLGEIKLEPEIYSGFPKKTGKTVFQPAFNSRIIAVNLFPGIDGGNIENLLGGNYKGIIIKAYGPGNVPFSLLPFFRKAEKMKIPVVILSQCYKGTTKMSLYEVGRVARTASVISGGDMTLESAVAKFMWILGNESGYEAIRKAMHKNLRGERN